MAAISRLEGDGHQDLKIVVDTEPEGCLILPVAPVDDDAGGNTEPGGHINGKLQVVQAKRCRFRDKDAGIAPIQGLDNRAGCARCSIDRLPADLRAARFFAALMIGTAWGLPVSSIPEISFRPGSGAEMDRVPIRFGSS